LLVRGRKFDIRLFVLLDHERNLFMYKEGFIRTSGKAYGIGGENVDDAAVHLTNTSV
jgi:hypothetical protein